MTRIEWTEETWNPLVGCSRVSEGCRHCYAERQAFRCAAMGWDRYEGLTKKIGDEIRWTGEVRLVASALERPLQWKKPRRIFVNSMSDLFHEAAKDDWIKDIFSIMEAAPHHTFQVLTKRPARMRAWASEFDRWLHYAGSVSFVEKFPHVWLGVSVEDQAAADERIPLLLQTPAAVRWVSYEPALGPVDFKPAPLHQWPDGSCWLPNKEEPDDWKYWTHRDYGIKWLVVGGESGPGARPFDIAWARQAVAQGRVAGIPVFVKQLGSAPFGSAIHQETGDLFPWSVPLRWSGDGCGTYRPILRDRKGGNVIEWPEDLRVREYPQ